MKALLLVATLLGCGAPTPAPEPVAPVTAITDGGAYAGSISDAGTTTAPTTPVQPPPCIPGQSPICT